MITRNDREETMMNEHKIMWRYGGKLLAAALGIALIAAPLQAAEVPRTAPAKVTPNPVPQATEIAPYLELAVGQSHLIRLPEKTRLDKVSVDDPKVVQVRVTSLRELVLNGRSPGSTVVMLKDKSGQTTVMDVTVVGGAVGKATGGLQGKLQQLLPGERNIRVASAADTVVLTGTASDAVKVDRAVALAEAYSGKKVLNFLQVGAPQQVMLEVKVAEVDKTLTDALGSRFTGALGGFNGNMTYSLLANFLTGTTNATPNAASITLGNAQKSLTLDGAKQDGLVKILAEPNIMAMSGQEGSFLAGGSIYIPVPQVGVGGSTITLEQKDFGVALKFTPTVLEDGRINLKVAPEVSELGRNITVGTQLLPTITTRRSATTVQLNDGQSFAIGGLIKSNVTATVTAFPGLGELPVIGALFRSTSFVHDRSELVFVITPRLVKPLPPDYVLPTDNYIQPSRAEYLLEGKLEGSPKAESQSQAAPAAPAEQAPASGGFQMK
ncbi:type II and III secretion system protein family protein [Ferrigenium kumadai]|nr:type II and III secretion system protein family protein [Ferrigenium kumadai]